MESSPQVKLLFDPLRKKWVVATEEEIVRQELIQRMIGELGFPKNLLAIEKELSTLSPTLGRALPHRRADILCFRKLKETFIPLILIECKQEALREEMIRQLVGYNYYLKAPFITLATKNQCVTGFWNGETYAFSSGMPNYLTLLSQLNE